MITVVASIQGLFCRHSTGLNAGVRGHISGMVVHESGKLFSAEKRYNGGEWGLVSKPAYKQVHDHTHLNFFGDVRASGVYQALIQRAWERGYGSHGQRGRLVR